MKRDTVTSRRLQYSYGNGTNNTVRRTGMTYVNGTALTYSYGAAGSSMSDVLSRPASLTENSQTTSYTYLGWERRVKVNLPAASSMFTLIDPASQAGGSGGDQYTGLDRFNRVSEVRWHRPSSTSYVELERVKYAFDLAGNRQWHDGLIAAGGQDELYTYDKLSQLTKLERGTLSGSSISSLVWKKEWKFDSAGNWHDNTANATGGGYKQTSSTTVLLDQNRANNKANEITEKDEKGQSVHMCRNEE